MKLRLAKDEMENKTDVLIDTVLSRVAQNWLYTDTVEARIPEHSGIDPRAVFVYGEGMCHILMFTTDRMEIAADELLLLDWEEQYKKLKPNALIDSLVEKAEKLDAVVAEKNVRVASIVYADIKQQPNITTVSFYCYGLMPIIQGGEA